MTEAGAIPRRELVEMLDLVEPDWTLQEGAAVDGGYHLVYRLTVDTGDRTVQCYLKATPFGEAGTVRLGSRVQALIGTHTGIPVPTVLGAVDDHADLPAPFVLMSAMSGTSGSRVELNSYPDETLAFMARETGRHLADLHALDVVDGYGYLSPAGPALSGEPPSGGVDSIAVEDPTSVWADQLRRSTRQELALAAETDLADLVPRVRPELASRIEGLEGPFEPVLARIDHSIENVLADEGRLTAFLDWGFTIVATRGYDLVHVTRSLAGGPYLYAPEMDDRRPLIREGLLDGYWSTAQAGRPDQVRANWSCYELLAAVRSIGHLSSWYRTFDLADRREDAMAVLRQDIRANL